MADVTFFFDPVCPWTWRASRWLATVAEARSLEIEWRPLSLLVLNNGPDEEHGTDLEVSQRALRLVALLHEAGRQDDIARFYTALGRLAYEERLAFDDDLVEQAVRSADLGADGAALDRPGLDDAVRRFSEEATAAAGPGVGSPVMTVPGGVRGLHGPVLKAVPDKPAALTLWDSVEPLFHLEEFLEIKRGRG